MTTWLSDASANRHIKTYVKDFLDLSGNMTVRNTNDYAWNNYGQVISGPYESDNNIWLGISVGMDVSGLTIVAGAHAQDGANTSSTNDGAVTVYRYDTSAEIWYQLGNTITGETTNSDFGHNVDINDAGNRIMAIDYTANFVNVYDYNSSTNTWDKQVSITTSDGIVGVSPYAGRISGDGNTIVFSDYQDNTNTGKQYVYRNTSGTTWTKIGEFTGPHTNTYAGIGCALSYDGNRVTFPEKDYDYDVDGNSSSDNGRVSIYDYSGSGTTWNQVGNYIYGEQGASDQFPASMDFSKDGSIVAFGIGDGDSATVFQYNATDGDWNQLGTKIEGPTDNGYGMGVRLSDDGTVLLVNDPNDDTAGTNNGALYIYKYTNGDWVQRGSTLYGTKEQGSLGYQFNGALAMSGDGTKIVAGAPWSDVNGTDSGYVQAWQWSQKYNTNPSLDISGGTMTMWGGAEHVVANYSVTQLGSTLTGASSGIAFGKSMDMDSTGTIWAIGDNYNTTYGSVSVYKYQNGGWYQLGSTLYGSNSSDYLGGDISISGDGKVLVLSALATGGFYTSGGTRVYGYVNTYRWFNGDWVLFGETSGYNTNVSIVPTNNHTSGSYWGALISTNNDGSVVAIGEINNTSKGGIWRYDSSSDSWSNEHIFGFRVFDIAMSRDGTRVVTGDSAADINVTNDGAIRVYDYNSSTQTWSQVGSTITGYETQDLIGYRVAISGDGNTFFQSASNESSDGNSYGQVYTYVQDASGGDGDWVQKGPDFVGDTTQRYGMGSSLDYDGDTLILGSPNVDLAQVYKYLDGYWQQIGDDIDFDGSTGTSTAVNDAGTIFAVGASATTNGTAVAYNLNNSPALKIENGKINDISVGAGSGANSISIGTNTIGSNANSIAIGTNVVTAGSKSVSIGTNVNVNGAFGIAIGNSAIGTGGCTIAIGYSANASVENAVAFGRSAVSTANASLALGHMTNALGSYSTAIGLAAYANSQSSVAIGRSALATNQGAVSLGAAANAYSGYSTSLGMNTKTTGEQCIAAGYGSQCSGYLGVAIGRSANVSNANSIAIGYAATSNASYSVAIGFQSATNSGGVSVALGYQANANGSESIAIGRQPVATGSSSIAIGKSASATGTLSTTIGTSATSNSYGGVGIGYNARALSSNYTLAIGHNSYCTGSNSSVIGVNANTTASNVIILGINGVKVGIGTNNPTKASLEISSYVTTYIGARFYNSGGANSYLTMNRNLSFYAHQHIACSELQVFSDRRIKKNIVDVPDDLALQMVRDIPCRYYEYVDTATKGTERTIGFIAQEVNEVLPMAVSISPGIIPDEYRELKNFTWEETDDNKYKLYCDLQDCSGVTYRFIATNNPSEDEGKYDSFDIVGNEDNSFTFEKKYDFMFCYGKEVDDFHRIDKQKIFAIAFSATQELDRLLQAEKAKVATLESQMADVLARLTALENA